MRSIVIGLMMCVLASCATKPSTPARLGLRLAPAQLDASISLQQHLTVECNGQINELDAALEIDDQHVQLVGLAFGQRVLSVDYDGKKLTTWRHVMLPKEVRAEDILEDIELTFWPIEAIRQALPLGWTIEESELQRTLYFNDEIICQINYSGLPRWKGTVRLDNLRYRYSLIIQSV